MRPFFRNSLKLDDCHSTIRSVPYGCPLATLLVAGYLYAWPGAAFADPPPTAATVKTTETVTVTGFGDPLGPPPLPSELRRTFPLGAACVPGIHYSPNAPWRWFGQRDSSGRLDALDVDKGYAPLVIPLHLSGVYKVQFLVPEVKRRGTPLGTFALSVKLSGTPSFSQLTVPAERNPRDYLTWNQLDLSGHNLVIAHPDGCSAALSAIRFIPLRDGQELPDAAETLEGTSLVAAVRSANSIYESNNPADVGAYFARLFAQMHAQHLDTVCVGNGDSIPEQLAVLDAAQRNGLKVLLSEEPVYGTIKVQVDALATTDAPAATRLIEGAFAPIVAAVKGHPALLAYMVHDEPFVEDAPGYRLLYQALRRLDPNHASTGYLCRAGWDTDSTTRRGLDNMKKFVDAVQADGLFNDLYPVRGEPNAIQACLDRYIVSLDDDVRQAGGRPLWIAPQTYRYGKVLRDPTPAEIRVQAYLSLGHGATGLIFYSYNAQDSSLFDKRGQPTADCEELGRLAADLLPLTATFLRLRRVQTTGTWPRLLDVQGFETASGQHYLLLVNKDVTTIHGYQIALTTHDIKRVVDSRNGQAYPLTGTTSRPTVNLVLQPGDGRLLCLEETKP